MIAPNLPEQNELEAALDKCTLPKRVEFFTSSENKQRVLPIFEGEDSKPTGEYAVYLCVNVPLRHCLLVKPGDDVQAKVKEAAEKQQQTLEEIRKLVESKNE